MRLPQVAAEMRELAALHGINRLSELADQIARRRPVKIAKAVSAKCTPQMRADICQCARDFPNWSQRRIAELFNVNPGRVSESLRGKRK